MQITQKMNRLKQVRSLPTTAGLETEWDYSGRKERDGQKKKIVKSHWEKGKVKKSKRRGREWTRGKGGEPAPRDDGTDILQTCTDVGNRQQRQRQNTPNYLLHLVHVVVSFF